MRILSLSGKRNYYTYKEMVLPFGYLYKMNSFIILIMLNTIFF